ncbi:MAG: hypothetical protein LBE38_05205 [Deltaproteobacteria bacterium]|jgi:hypothetical protein|nr:hypothetical protein [Deltaproteobacteria bacterium]
MDNVTLASILESGMLIAFGCAWPANILHTLRHKSVKGKSLAFLLIVLLGYIFGILAKLIIGNLSYVLFFYILNTVMVFTDLVLYFYYLSKENKS